MVPRVFYPLQCANTCSIRLSHRSTAQRVEGEFGTSSERNLPHNNSLDRGFVALLSKADDTNAKNTKRDAMLLQGHNVVHRGAMPTTNMLWTSPDSHCKNKLGPLYNFNQYNFNQGLIGSTFNPCMS